jgi:phospholipid/cholesterol/gamma-HCH transport system substrate-binding protein
MQTSRSVEIWVGIFVALGAAALLGLALRVSNLTEFQEGPSYELTAQFANVGGLKVRAPVTVAGVRVGRVKAIDLDPSSLRAKVTLSILAQYDQLPEDTSASILTAGLLGDQYIGLQPGAPEFFLEPGDEIQYTQSAMVLEQLISRFLFSQTEGE